MGVSKGFLFSVSLSLSLPTEMLLRHHCNSSGIQLVDTCYSIPTRITASANGQENPYGNAGVSVQMSTSFRHQLNMSLLCSATKQQSPGPLFVLLHSSPALVPGVSSFRAPRVAQGYCANKTLAGDSAWGAGNTARPLAAMVSARLG